jgi:hypothetical protein
MGLTILDWKHRETLMDEEKQEASEAGLMANLHSARLTPSVGRQGRLHPPALPLR